MFTALALFKWSILGCARTKCGDPAHTSGTQGSARKPPAHLYEDTMQRGEPDSVSTASIPRQEGSGFHCYSSFDLLSCLL